MSIKTPQQVFNEIRGQIVEMNKDGEWSNIVLSVGHENKRLVNLVCKTETFNRLIKEINVSIDHFVLCRFYLVSRNTNGRYYTNANLLAIQKISEMENRLV